MEIPTYLLSTAYGQRKQRLSKRAADSEGGLEEHQSSGWSGYSGAGRPGSAASGPRRIYNKTMAVRSGSSGSGSPLLGNWQQQQAPQARRTPAPSTPSTLPIFRDEDRQSITTRSSSIGATDSDDEYEMDGKLKGSDSNSISNTTLLLPSQEVLPELPHGWATKGEIDQAVLVSNSGKCIEYKTEGKPNMQEARALKTDYAIPGLCGVYYYEVEISSCTRDIMMGIGFCTAAANITKPPGLEHHSWGYHSDDGKAAEDQKPGFDYGPVFGCGDIIGCGLDFTTMSIFFTKNGISLGYAFEDLDTQDSKTKEDLKYYPCVGFKPTVLLKSNFGDQEFLFDINQYVQERKKSLMDTITKVDQQLPRLEGLGAASGGELSQSDVSGLVQDLISSYFSYLGYVDSAKAFEQEIRQETAAKEGNEIVEEDQRMLDSGEDTEGGTKEDLEVMNRQRISRLITDGQIDRALKYLKLFYPHVLEEKDSLVVFKLECCKFIELVRATIPSESGLQDVEMGDASGGASTSISGQEFDRDAALSEAVAYGQQLRLRYKDDTRGFVRKRLSLVFSLLAYDDPREDESVAFLLNEGERFALAEEVNSRILVSQGKAPIPPLQMVAQHAMGVVWELQNKGRLETNVLNIEQDFF